MPTKQFSNYESLITFTRASKGHALRPVSYGDELVTNGDFSSSDDWGTGAGWSVSNGVASHTGATAGYLTQTNVTEVGKIYKISFDITALASGKAILVYNYTGGSSVLSFDTTGSVSGFFVAEDTKLAIRESASAECTIDNVSVKEVLFDQPDGSLILFEHPNNFPRVEYDADGNRLGLLVEEARTNYLPYSEDLTASGWTASGATTIGQQQTTNEYLGKYWPISLSDTISHFFQFRLSNLIADGTQTAMSVLIRTANGEGTRTIRFKHGRDGFFVDKSIGEEWQIVSTVDNNSGATKEFFGISSPDGSACNVEVQFFQVEQGSFPTSYIKNEGTPSGATRSADVASIPVADFGYNQSAGTVFVEAKGIGDGVNFPRFVNFQDDSSNRWELIGDTGLDVRMFQRFSATSDVNSDIILNVLDGQTNIKLAYAKAENDAAGSGNGSAVVTDTSNGQLSSVDTLYIGVGSDGGTDFLTGHIKSIKYYPRRLTNAQLQDLTS